MVDSLGRRGFGVGFRTRPFATLAAVLYLGPRLFPFFSPCERKLAYGANFAG